MKNNRTAFLCFVCFVFVYMFFCVRATLPHQIKPSHNRLIYLYENMLLCVCVRSVQKCGVFVCAVRFKHNRKPDAAYHTAHGSGTGPLAPFVKFGVRCVLS